MTTRRKAAPKCNKPEAIVESVECKIQELWVDQFRPHNFEDLTYHGDVNERLNHLVASDEERHSLPHLLLYGPSGGGKRTRVQCLLNALYRLSPEQLKSMQFGSEHRENGGQPQTQVRKSDNTVSGVEELVRPLRLCLQLNNVSASGVSEVFVFRSPFHLELTPSDLGYRDFHVVQQALKAFVESGSQTMYTYMRKKQQTQSDRLASMFNAQKTKEQEKGKEEEEEEEEHQNPQFRVVVINQADRLTHEAQAALRRTMEAYTDHVRFILIAERIEGVIDPIQSRCLPVRVPLVPQSSVHGISESIIERTLRYVLRQYANYRNSPHRVNAFLKNVAMHAFGDMTRAFLLMQCSVANLPEYKNVQYISPKNDLLQPDWIDTVSGIVDAVTVPNLNTSHMTAARSLMRDLQTHCIPPRSIVWTLYTQLVARLNCEAESDQKEAVSALCADLVWLCAEYERRCVLSHFYVVHLDTLLARIMLAIGLHQRGGQYTDDRDALNARYRAYDTVYPAARRMHYTHRASTMQIFTPPAPPPPSTATTQQQQQQQKDHQKHPSDIWDKIWSFSDVDDIRDLKSLCVSEP